ncbi:MAG: hypothetical protein WAU48_07430 [Gammaproteobacteria bacterium]
MCRTASNAAGVGLFIKAVAAAALSASLTACIHLPPAVAAEMQPAAPPTVNHYRKPQAADAPRHAIAAP